MIVSYPLVVCARMVTRELMFFVSLFFFLFYSYIGNASDELSMLVPKYVIHLYWIYLYFYIFVSVVDCDSFGNLTISSAL